MPALKALKISIHKPSFFFECDPLDFYKVWIYFANREDRVCNQCYCNNLDPKFEKTQLHLQLLPSKCSERHLSRLYGQIITRSITVNINVSSVADICERSASKECSRGRRRSGIENMKVMKTACRLITKKTLRLSLRRLTLQSNTLISLRSHDLFLYSRVGSEAESLWSFSILTILTLLSTHKCRENTSVM